MEPILANLWEFILTLALGLALGSIVTDLGFWRWLASLLRWKKSDV